MKTAYYKFHKYVNVRFRTDNANFYDFVDENYRLFKSNKEISRVNLDIIVHFSKKTPPKVNQRISANLFTDGNRVLYFDSGGFKVYAIERENLLEVNTYTYAPKNLFREILKFVFHRRETVLYEKYLGLMRTSIHLPLFYLLESKGFILLHGSVVSKNGEGYLFLGGNHVGKTTIALNLVYNHNFKFLTDDFILIRDNKLFAFPEKVRVKPDILSFLPIEPEGRLIYSKYHLCLPEEKVAMFTYPRKVFFVGDSATPKLQKIDISMALKQLNAIHNYLHEFPEYSYLAFLPKYPIGDIQDRYASFLEDKNIRSLQLSPDHNKNVKLILGGFDQ